MGSDSQREEHIEKIRLYVKNNPGRLFVVVGLWMMVMWGTRVVPIAPPEGVATAGKITWFHTISYLLMVLNLQVLVFGALFVFSQSDVDEQQAEDCDHSSHGNVDR